MNLTPKETDILNALAERRSFPQICALLKINLACLYVHCQHIRQKTGIEHLRNHMACLQWLSSNPKGAIAKGPTPRQMEMLRLFAEQKPARIIAKLMGIGEQTVINQLATACTRAGLRSFPGRDRCAQVREWLAANHPVTMDDPAFS